MKTNNDNCSTPVNNLIYESTSCFDAMGRDVKNATNLGTTGVGVFAGKFNDMIGLFNFDVGDSSLTVVPNLTNKTIEYTVAISAAPGNGLSLNLDGLFASSSGGSGITDLTGDVTATGPGSVVATISNDAVTYAKMQDVSATNRLLGRVSAGAGNVEEVVLDLDGTLAADSDDIVASQKAVKTYVDSRTGLYDTTITEVNGTATVAEELLHAFTIAGGVCVNLDTVIVRVLGSFSSVSGSDKTFRVRVDTSATGVTGTVISLFQSNNSSGNTIYLKVWQDIKCKANGGNTLEAAYNSSGAFAQGLLNFIGLANINLASTWYIKITSDKAVVGDTMTLKYADVEIHKN